MTVDRLTKEPHGELGGGSVGRDRDREGLSGVARWLHWLAVTLFVVAFVAHLREDHDMFFWFFMAAMALNIVAGILRSRSET